MKRDFLKEMELSDEQINQIMAEHGKTVNEIKEKADKVDTLESQIEDYQTQIAERDKQLKDLSKKANGNEELQQQIKDLQTANDEAQKDFEKKLEHQKKESRIELALKDAGARNPKIVKAQIDLDKVSVDGDNLVGFNEQLDSLKESDAYLFGEEEPKSLKGRQPQPTSQKPSDTLTQEKFNQMGYSEKAKLYQEQPDLYNQLAKGE